QDHVSGVGLVRPLFFSWPHDPHLRNDDQAWLFGQWLLVSPVVHRHQRTKQLYLPPGTWTNFFTGQVYHGGTTVTLKLDVKTWTDIPLFVRQGAIVPMQPLMQYVGEHPVRTLTVEVFPTQHPTHFDYYDDNGETYAYQHGQYFLQRIGTERRAGVVHLTLGAVRGSYRPALRRYLFVLHRVQGRTVEINGQVLQRAASRAALSGCIHACWAGSTDRFGPVTYVEMAAERRAQIRVVVHLR
ncbi:MAG: DUF5110 domain-containing protein, partial [Steroidobacteraceae bacterium]